MRANAIGRNYKVTPAINADKNQQAILSSAHVQPGNVTFGNNKFDILAGLKKIFLKKPKEYINDKFFIKQMGKIKNEASPIIQIFSPNGKLLIEDEKVTQKLEKVIKGNYILTSNREEPLEFVQIISYLELEPKKVFNVANDGIEIITLPKEITKETVTLANDMYYGKLGDDITIKPPLLHKEKFMNSMGGGLSKEEISSHCSDLGIEYKRRNWPDS